MRRLFSTLRSRYRNSRYARPVLFTLVFFLVAGSLALFFELGRNDQFTNLLDGFWWLIVTFSTTGYGDKVPVTLGGRILAVVTIFFGVGAMSLLSGGLASWLVDRNTKARRGLMEFPKLKDHLIICGWKTDMKEVLTGILHVSPKLTSDQIVILSNVDAEKVEELKEEEMLRGLKFVRGDYFSELTLDRANVQKARKVLVIADTLESAAVSEVDSKTVMTVLTVKSMARTVYVTAEVLDRKFESYLKHANCDEILFSRDFSRQMLASTSATNGMSHIIHELLAHERTDSRLSTKEIPSRYIGGFFKDFRADYESPSRRVVLGVLENTGTPTRMKMEALREAQKTSDVSQLIANLQNVKGLEVNRPVFLPADDYQLQQHSLAIVLEREDESENGTD